MRMRIIGIFWLLVIGTLTGCDQAQMGQGGLSMLSRGDPRPVDVTAMPAFRLVGWQIEVPETLTVSEENRIKPLADIVWRGDAFGDRHAQVEAIFETAVSRAAGRLGGNMPVTIGISVSRFHAVTDFLRYQFAGQHEIEFTLTAVNATTGETIVPPYLVNATFPAFGGNDAVVADRLGLTQKSRILQQLENRLVQELTGAPVENISGALPDAAAEAS